MTVTHREGEALSPPDGQDQKEMVEQETGYARARDRSLARLRDGMDLGTGGHSDWSRDSVHER